MVELFTSLSENVELILACLVADLIEMHIHPRLFLLAVVVHEGGSYLFIELEEYGSLRVSHFIEGPDAGD